MFQRIWLPTFSFETLQIGQQNPFVSNDKPCPLVQVTENLDCYKQVDGAIYEISNGSPVE